jgi:YesN/AraC family two-component response regulator
MIRILLVDDQALLCEVLKTWLEVEQDFEVVGIARNGEEGIEKVDALRPDIVLIDIEMPGMNGLNATTIIKQRFPEVKVIVLSAHDDDAYVGKSVRAGAKGYILKNTTAEELAAKIRAINNGSEALISNSNSSKEEIDLANLKEEIMQETILFSQKQIESYLATLKSSNGENLEESLAQLQKTTEKNYNELRSELIATQSKLGEVNRNFSAQVNQQLVHLKKELEEQLSTTVDRWSQERTALQEWAVQREEIYPSTDELELKFRNELMAVINPMRTSIRETNKQIRFLRSWIFALGLTSALALTFAGIATYTSNTSNSNVQQTTKK